MDTLSYKTVSVNKETIQKEWVLIDLKDEVLGRAASKIAKILRGKHKPSFTPHVDCGDNVIVINAEKIRLTGKKWTDKEYVRYSGYPGGQTITTPEELHRKRPEALIEHAVKGMLPRNRLSNRIINNLHVFVGEGHTHEAQKPKKLNLNSIK